MDKRLASYTEKSMESKFLVVNPDSEVDLSITEEKIFFIVVPFIINCAQPKFENILNDRVSKCVQYLTGIESSDVSVIDVKEVKEMLFKRDLIRSVRYKWVENAVIELSDLGLAYLEKYWNDSITQSLIWFDTSENQT